MVILSFSPPICARGRLFVFLVRGAQTTPLPQDNHFFD
jgi:hypothetical protein